MAEDKRVKLGVDIGELSNQLVQINGLVENNYKLAVQGQQAYNSILQDSIDSLKIQVDLISQISDKVNNLQNFRTLNIVNSSDSSSTFTEENSDNDSNNNSNSILNEAEVRKILIMVDRVRSTMPNSKQDAREDNENQDIEEDENRVLKEINENIINIYNKLIETGNQPANPPTSDDGDDGSNSGDGDDDSNDGGSNNGGNNGGNGNNKGGRGTGSTVGGAFNQGVAAVTQKDPNYMFAAAIGMIPIVGAGLSSLFQRVLGAAEALDDASHLLRATTGGYGGNLGSFQNIGLSQAEADQKIAAYYRYNTNVDRNTLLWEKGWNLDAGTLGGLLQSTRKDVLEFVNPSTLGMSYIKNLMYNSGISDTEVRGYAPEYLQILVDLNRKQLENTGQTNSILNGAIITGIADLASELEDPTILNRVIQSLENGLSQASTPQLEALQYYALSQVNPNANLWEMQLMRENPLANPDYVSEYLDILLKTGNDQDVKFNFQNAFGLSASQTEYLVNGLKKIKDKGDLFEYFSKNYNSIIKTEDFDAGAATSSKQQLSAKSEDLMADVGGPILEWTTEISNDILTYLEYVKNTFERSDSFMDAMETFFNDFFDKLKGALSEWWDSVDLNLLSYNPNTNNIIDPSIYHNNISPNNMQA